MLSNRQRELLQKAYFASREAHDGIRLIDLTQNASRLQADQALLSLRSATAAWQSFSDLTAGIPEPQKG